MKRYLLLACLLVLSVPFAPVAAAGSPVCAEVTTTRPFVDASDCVPDIPRCYPGPNGTWYCHG